MKKKEIEFVFEKPGNEIVKTMVAAIVTRFKKDFSLKPDEGKAMLTLIANGEELELPDEMKASDKKFMKEMFKKLSLIVTNSDKLEKEQRAIEEKKKATQLERGKKLEIATTKGFAKNELMVDTAIATLQKTVGKKFVVTSCGLTAADGETPNEGELAEVIATLANGTDGMQRVTNALTWSLGDAALLASKILGEEPANQMIEQVISTTGRQKHTIVDAIRVCRIHPPDKRHETLSFTHHQELANYSGKIKPKVLDGIIEKVVTGDSVTITKPDGEAVVQSRPLSCAKMRKMLQEAANPVTAPPKAVAKEAEVKTNDDKDNEEGTAVGIAPAANYIIIDSESNVYRCEELTEELALNENVYIVIDLETMTTMITKKNKFVEGEPILEIPDDFNPSSDAVVIPDIDGNAEGDGNELPDG